VPTAKQELGKLGEELVARHVACPSCKRVRTLRRLPTNFKCADLICDFCGYLAQVKAATSDDPAVLPKSVLGAAWSVQKERMDAGIYFPLFLVLYRSGRNFTIYYLSADLQPPTMFKPRNPLSATARRAGWQGFVYDLTAVPTGGFVRVFSAS
jgi:hypothetical protein